MPSVSMRSNSSPASGDFSCIRVSAMAQSQPSPSTANRHSTGSPTRTATFDIGPSSCSSRISCNAGSISVFSIAATAGVLTPVASSLRWIGNAITTIRQESFSIATWMRNTDIEAYHRVTKSRKLMPADRTMALFFNRSRRSSINLRQSDCHANLGRHPYSISTTSEPSLNSARESAGEASRTARNRHCRGSPASNFISITRTDALRQRASSISGKNRPRSFYRVYSQL